MKYGKQKINQTIKFYKRKILFVRSHIQMNNLGTLYKKTTENNFTSDEKKTKFCLWWLMASRTNCKFSVQIKACIKNK